MREFVASGEVEPASSAELVEPRPASRAKRKVAAGPRPTKVTIDELLAKGRTVIDRIEAVVHRVADRIGRRAARGHKSHR